MKSIESAESKLASYHGVKHALMTSRGRTALVVALKALGVGSGDDVMLPSFCCDILAKCVEFCGARPIFADVNPLTFNVNPQEIERNITRNTKAVLVIHCYGQPADMREILEMAGKNNIPVIENVAHSIGAEYHGKKVGGLGHLSIFSFLKNIGCSSGGALATDSDDLILRAKSVLENLSAGENAISRFRYTMKRRLLGLGRGQKFLLSSLKLLSLARKFEYSATDEIPVLFGANSRMAAEVMKGLGSIDQRNESRRRKARVLTGLINDLKIDYIVPPFEEEDRIHVYYLYGLKFHRRTRVLKKLREIEKYTFWSLPWQCPYGSEAKELSRQLIVFEMNPEPSEKDVHLIAYALSSTSKSA